jgi:predicted anti-sigma-YlaC factor YlaD
MRCEVFENLLSLDNGVNLKGELKKRFEEHRANCPQCEQVFMSMKVLDKSLFNMTHPVVSARPDFENRVMMRIHKGKKHSMGFAASFIFTAVAFLVLVWYGFNISYVDIISGLDSLLMLARNVIPSVSDFSTSPIMLRTLFVGGGFVWLCVMAFALRFVLEESEHWLSKGHFPRR